METFRIKRFSILNFFNKKNSSTRNRSINIGEILFSLSIGDYYPAVVCMGLKYRKKNTTEKDVLILENGFKSWGLIKNTDYITGYYKITGNKKGDNGLTCILVVFNSDAKINSQIRLLYGDKIKWPEDFEYNYKSWYRY